MFKVNNTDTNCKQQKQQQQMSQLTSFMFSRVIKWVKVK